TNGRLLNEKNIPIFVRDLSFIRFSVNAGTKATYAKIHGTQETDFDIVLKHLQNFVEEKRKTGSDVTIGVQCVLLSYNQHEIKELERIVTQLGVSYLSVKPFLKHAEIKFDDRIEHLPSVLDDLSTFGHDISGNG